MNIPVTTTAELQGYQIVSYVTVLRARRKGADLTSLMQDQADGKAMGVLADEESWAIVGVHEQNNIVLGTLVRVRPSP